MATTFDPDYIAKYKESDVKNGYVGPDGMIKFPAFDPVEDEGAVLKIVGGKPTWYNEVS